MAPIDSLRSPAEFEPVFAGGHKAEHGGVSVRILLRDELGIVRLGLIAPKKKAPLASRRNAFKRVARESIRSFAKDLGDARSADVVVALIGSGKDVEVEVFKERVRADLTAAIQSAMTLALSGQAPGAKPRKPKP